jgi:hypothetical protein
MNQSLGHVPVTAADVEDEAPGWKAAYGGRDASVAMAEPERVVLEQETSGVVVVRVRDRGATVGTPDPGVWIEAQDVAQ